MPHIGSNVLALGKRTPHVTSNAFALESQRIVGQQQLSATWWIALRKKQNMKFNDVFTNLTSHFVWQIQFCGGQ
jgi:hypothetical protein